MTASAGAVVTVTMNPALDVSVDVDRVEPERKLRCGPSGFDPGGGGVNVSRALHNLGGQSLAVLPLSGPTGTTYRRLLDLTGVRALIIAVAAETRESLTVTETSTRRQYRFVLRGPTLSEAEWRACLAALIARLPREGYLIASGSLPPGVPQDFYARLAHSAAERDCRLIVDAAGPALAEALEAGVYAIKPSRDELTELSGLAAGPGTDDLVDAARDLVRAGKTEMVVLSLGREGAVLVTGAEVHHQAAAGLEPISTVGAGDALLAGFVLRLSQGRSATDALRTGVAAGCAAAMIAGTGLCRAQDVRRVERELRPVDRIPAPPPPISEPTGSPPRSA